MKSAPKRAEPIGPSPYAQALADTGISTQSASRYQALANVPHETFEAALRDPEKPTTAGVLARALKCLGDPRVVLVEPNGEQAVGVKRRLRHDGRPPSGCAVQPLHVGRLRLALGQRLQPIGPGLQRVALLVHVLVLIVVAALHPAQAVR